MLQQIERTRRKKEVCDCPVCSGLVCAERPRFFAGQLLTEMELNDAQSYVLAKNRLHNRYLHGYGIVCGLEVSCHDCDGWVTVHPGYALDQCGNDIIVCDPHDFDVIDAIERCREDDRRRSDCDPWRSPHDADCQDVVQTWCIAIKYKENEGRPTTALRSQTANRCGCDPTGKANGSQSCTCGGKNGNGRQRSATTVGTCEPTRILEQYELCVVPAPERVRDELSPNFERARPSFESRLFAADSFGIMDGYVDLLAKVSACRRTENEFRAEINRLRALLDNFQQRFELHAALCRLRDRMKNQLLTTLRADCTLLERLAMVPLPQPPQGDDGFANWQQVIASSLDALDALARAILIQCICYLALPGCPIDPCEDRLILACVTVRGDKILNICHRDWRRYVPTLHNLLPILLGLEARDACCADFAMEGDVAAPKPGVVINPNFASFVRAVGGVSAAATARPSATLESARFVGGDATLVAATLRERGVETVEMEEVSWSPAERSVRGLEMPEIAVDEPVRLFVQEGKVVGFGRWTERDRLRADLDAANVRLERLEAMLRDRFGDDYESAK